MGRGLVRSVPRRYCDLSFEVGPGGVVALEADGVVLVSGDDVLDGELELVDGGELGVIELDEDDEGDDGDGVEGFIVEDEVDEPDGDGATTGGVVDVVDVDDSRWQPASPSARPVHSSVTKALRIVISNRVKGALPLRISRIDAMSRLKKQRTTQEIPS